MQIHSSKGLCPIAFISKRRGRWSLMLHLCQLNYLFVAKPKHATDVCNEGDTNLLHPLNNPLTTLKPQYSIECKTWPVITAKNIQDQVKVVGFYQPFHTRPILTPGIRICSQKWSQVNISIGYRYISQVKLLYKVKFSKLEICQSDCRFKILGKNYQKKVSFFFLNFEGNIFKISVKQPKLLFCLNSTSF